MKERIYITAYNRPDMLKALSSELYHKGVKPVVYYDGLRPEYSTPSMRCHEHRGKEGFYKTWDDMLKDGKGSDADLFIFLQDDVSNVNLEQIRHLHSLLNHSAYAFQLINDGRVNCWNVFEPKWITPIVQEIGFVDCLMFCNREALDKLRWTVRKNPDKIQRRMVSSGVGFYLSTQFMKRGVRMYRPYKSLVYHGNHDSVMHYEHRKNTPLISK